MSVDLLANTTYISEVGVYGVCVSNINLIFINMYVQLNAASEIIIKYLTYFLIWISLVVHNDNNEHSWTYFNGVEVSSQRNRTRFALKTIVLLSVLMITYYYKNNRILVITRIDLLILFILSTVNGWRKTFTLLYIWFCRFKRTLNGSEKKNVWFADLSVTQVVPTSPQRVRDIRNTHEGCFWIQQKACIEDSLERI